MMKIVERMRDTLPPAAAASALVVLACVFSASLRDMLLQADLDLLAGAMALLPLAAVLLAFSLGLGGRRQRQRDAARRHARLHATYDVDPRA